MAKRKARQSQKEKEWGGLESLHRKTERMTTLWGGGGEWPGNGGWGWCWGGGGGARDTPKRKSGVAAAPRSG
jgi:hypothetical protein